MFKLIKFILLLIIVAGVAFYAWALPKLNFVWQNPSFCAQVTKNIYYCGDKAEVSHIVEKTK